MKLERQIRVLGKGLTAQAIKSKFKNAILYDEANFDTYDKNSDELTVVSPGIPPDNYMVKEASNIISDYDLFKMPFSIWISGTNGKTTTTQMMQHILSEYGSLCGGNIGIPLSSLKEDAPIWILETSSFTFHYTKEACPNLYVLLPISEDHISWHGSYQAYKEAKLKPLALMKEGEIAIIPDEFKDYPTKAMKITYKSSDDLCQEFEIDKSKINFKEPFLLDAILALCTKKIVFDEIDYKSINSFVIDKHKVEEFYDSSKRLWINDSKATNVDATLNALVPYLNKKIYLILGGDDKGANLRPLFEAIKNKNIEVFNIGSNYERLNILCKEFNIEYTSSKTLKNSIENISIKHNEKSVAILSPSASSLDQFESYAVRGNLFKELVNNLSKN